MKIVFVASEVVPFAKTGGLADVVGALPKALAKEGHEVCVFMPRYKSIDKKKFSLKMELKNIRLRLGKLAMKQFNLFSSKLPNTEIPIYFIEKESYFFRDNLYQENGIDYADNAERFFYFNLAVLKSLKLLNFQPDVIHCHDWQTAMIPMYLKTELKDTPFYKDIASVYTIHNLAYHGLFEDKVLDELGISRDLFTYDKLEFWNKVNFSKAGLIFSDILSTVSESYAKEIQTPEAGCGLDGLLKSRASDLFGVLNGIDYSIWNPETDPHIARKYSINNLQDKEENKRKLLEMNGFEYRQNVPVFGMISRLADQKGFDILAEMLPKLLERDIYFILLATGEPKYHELFTNLQNQFPNKVKAHLRFDAALAQMIYAGADMFLMPSHFEPCGLSQLICLKYATVPIVRATGGLADSIKDIDMFPSEGTGYVFSEYTSEELWHTIERAMDCYYNNKGKWQWIQSNGMRSDFSWDASARHYNQLYQTAKERKQCGSGCECSKTEEMCCCPSA